MSELEQLKRLAARKSGLTVISDANAQDIRQRYPFIPSDYVSVLREIGWGSYPNGFMIYSGPIWPSEVFDTKACQLLGGVVLIGDDMQGIVVGYQESRPGTLIEIDSVNPSELHAEADIVSYLLNWAV